MGRILALSALVACLVAVNGANLPVPLTLAAGHFNPHDALSRDGIIAMKAPVSLHFKEDVILTFGYWKCQNL